MNARLRQDTIVRTLRRTGSSTIAELAETVGASRRTVLRDISVLRDEGFIIHSDPGPGGGVQLDPQSILTTPKLSVAEVFALLISVASMRAAGGMPFSGLADAGLAKIEQALPKDKVRDLRRFLACLYIGELAPQVDISDLGTMDSELLPAFETAFLQRVPLSFEYKDAKGHITQRSVEPQAMLILPPVWYLVSWDPDKQDFRHFRMDRIKRPELLAGSRFQRRHVPFEGKVSPIGKLPR